MSDFAVGTDSMGVEALIDFHDVVNWKFGWRVEKWDQDQVDWAAEHHFRRSNLRHQALMLVRRKSIPSSIIRKLLVPEIQEVEGNLLLNEGIQLMLDLLIGAGGTVMSNANAQTGVGDSSTAEAATQTDLQAASNKLFKGMNATFPSRSNQTLTFQSDFTGSEANYAWNEASLRNSSGADKNLNRKVVSLGTKASGTWTLTGTVTVS